MRIKLKRQITIFPFCFVFPKSFVHSFQESIFLSCILVVFMMVMLWSIIIFEKSPSPCSIGLHLLVQRHVHPTKPLVAILFIGSVTQQAYPNVFCTSFPTELMHACINSFSKRKSNVILQYGKPYASMECFPNAHMPIHPCVMRIYKFPQKIPQLQLNEFRTNLDLGANIHHLSSPLSNLATRDDSTFVAGQENMIGN